MKKLLFIFLITLFPLFLLAQQVKPDGSNWKHTGNNTFTKQIIIQTDTLTGNKITQLEELINNKSDTVSINDIITVPTIFQAAGDTSNYNIPGKAGNIFIDTSAGKIYISKSALRNGWVILN